MEGEGDSLVEAARFSLAIAAFRGLSSVSPVDILGREEGDSGGETEGERGCVRRGERERELERERRKAGLDASLYARGVAPGVLYYVSSRLEAAVERLEEIRWRRIETDPVSGYCRGMSLLLLA